jgi:predicted NBD/HSP70 family sugar kinase
LGINPATVSRITRSLLDEGLIKEEGEVQTKGSGRKPILLKFNHASRLVIGIYISRRQLTGVVADLAGVIMTRRTILRQESSIAQLATLIEILLNANPNYRQRLTTICIGTEPPSSFDVALTDELSNMFEIPVYHAHSASLAALAESEIGSMETQPVFMLFYLDASSSNCFFINRQTQVGDLGWLYEGKPLSDLLCDDGLLAAYANAKKQSPDYDHSQTETSARAVFEAARQCDWAAQQALSQVVEGVVMAIVLAANILNLTHVVIAGSWVRAATVIVPAIRERLQAVHPTPPHIVAAECGDDAPLIGTIRLAVSQVDITI